MKASVVTIVGRPSAGKSTLLNHLCGRKVSIVSRAPQTTRNTVRGVVTDPRGQLVFIDTPGFHLSNRKINLKMKALVSDALRDVDIVLYLVDASRAAGEEEQAIAETLAASRAPVVVAVNKIDLADEADRAAGREAFLRKLLPESPVKRLSALTGDGVQELLALLFDLSPEGEQMYPEEFYTDQPPEFRVSEIIREKAIERVRQEIPHALYVEIADMELPTAGEAPEGGEEAEASEREQRLWIRAFLVVERESQKGILVGKGGSMIKEIRTSAQREIEELFPYRTHLDLRVKVNAKWRKSDPTLKRIIY